MVIPASMTPGTLAHLHDAHQVLTSMLHPARRTVYWPMLQDDISEMVQKCNECQRYCNKKPRPPERQISATCPLELMGAKVVQFQCHSRLLFCFFTYDTLSSETTEAATKALHNIFRKFGLPEKIISDNAHASSLKSLDDFVTSLTLAMQHPEKRSHRKGNYYS